MNRKKILILVTIITILILFGIISINHTSRYNKLLISNSEFENIINTKKENKNLKLKNIKFNGYDLIIDEKNNTLYYSLVNNSKNKYNPTVKFEPLENKIKIAILSEEITDQKVKNNHLFKVIIYNKEQYRIYNLKCTQLPVINISYKEEIGNKQKNIPIRVYIFNNLTNIANKIVFSDGRLKINQTGFTIFLDVLTPGKNIRDNILSIFNMKPSSKYTIEEKNIGNSSGQDIELFINNEYKGIYVLNPIFNEGKKEIYEK